MGARAAAVVLGAVLAGACSDDSEGRDDRTTHLTSICS